MAFVPSINISHRRRQSTSLNLEDEIAEMIDRELYRIQHKDIFEVEQAKRTRASIASTTPQVDLSMENFQMFDEDIVQQRRDKKLARERPEKYCANRCVATGNCDVFEEFFELSPEEVLQFCLDCVLSEDEEPCDVPNPKVTFDKYIYELQP